MCTLGKMVPSASRNSELEGILTWYQVCSENGCKWLQHLRSANITQNVSSSFDKENIIQWEFEKDQLPLIYIYIYSLFVHPCSQMMTWWNLISHWFSSNDTPSMAHQDPNDLPQENLTDTISLPHGDSLWAHHEGQWESKVLETDNNLSNQSEADPWEGPGVGSFFLFQNGLQ